VPEALGRGPQLRDLLAVQARLLAPLHLPRGSLLEKPRVRAAVDVEPTRVEREDPVDGVVEQSDVV
jgi:hypothetical protein